MLQLTIRFLNKAIHPLIDVFRCWKSRRNFRGIRLETGSTPVTANLLAQQLDRNL